MQQFEGTIQEADRGGAYIPVPPPVLEALGGGGRIPVRATFDGIPYTGSIANMGNGPCLGILKAVQTELNKSPGDKVTVTVERDTAERTVEVPTDLAEALNQKGLRPAFDKLGYTTRKEHSLSVTDAKRPETRTRRIEKIITSLGG
ncbi:YdeI/OmpD-associated family protein [Nocardia sp. NPDC088792]|uniref:YdeI/OmpD-associated family protein n=1 Tax=Nocardia sp. NPDC088792 TaxID=3364332 RepID=UPI00380EC436